MLLITPSLVGTLYASSRSWNEATITPIAPKADGTSDVGRTSPKAPSKLLARKSRPLTNAQRSAFANASGWWLIEVSLSKNSDKLREKPWEAATLLRRELRTEQLDRDKEVTEHGRPNRKASWE